MHIFEIKEACEKKKIIKDKIKPKRFNCVSEEHSVVGTSSALNPLV